MAGVGAGAADGGCLAGAALQLVDARVTGDEALTQLLVLLTETAQFDHDLVEEVVDLVLVVSLAELRRVEPLVDYVFRRERHGRHLVHFLYPSITCAPTLARTASWQECGRH